MKPRAEDVTVILPTEFARLAANGRATIALIPVRDARDIARRNGTSYRSQPWQPTTGRHEPLRMSLPGTQTSTCSLCGSALQPSRARAGALWCWSCDRYDTPGPKTRHVADIIIGDHSTLLLDALLDDTPEMFRLVRAAGFKTRVDFAREWMRHYSRGTWPGRTEALCPRCNGFAVLEDVEECPDCELGTILVDDVPEDAAVLARFKARHGLTLVHAVTFQLDKPERRRLLSPSSRPRGDELGYTENPANALQDAGEAVPLSFQTDLSKDASERDAGRRQRRIDGAIASGDLDALEREPGRDARARARAARHRDAA